MILINQFLIIQYLNIQYATFAIEGWERGTSMTHTYDSYDIVIRGSNGVQMTKCMYRLQLFKLRWFRHPLDEVMREKAVKMTRPFF